MFKPLREQVVVLTGASSGIGRATAHELARRGASIVLAARTEDALDEVAGEVEREGGQAHAVPTDVSDWGQVQRLAQEAQNRFGRIDTWINDAAVSQYATVEDTTPEEAEQIVRIDLLGQIFGSKAALAVMKRQGFGSIINVASIVGVFGVPLQSIYSASKFGVRGFSESLRRELQHEGSPINVSMILPAGINTPFFAHARSKVPGKPMPLPPAYEPEEVANAIVSVCEHPQREVVVGGAGVLFTVMERISPALVDWTMRLGKLGTKGQIADQADDGKDNLFGPVDGPHRVHGDFEHITFTSSLYTRLLELHPAWKGALVGASVLGAVTLLQRLGRSAAG
jgi:NAD(P)-dependent dehydrogenase (short-subunit alcohol dehydrogenase family)